MENERLNITVQPNEKGELIVRHGVALEPVRPIQFTLNGQIESPLIFIEQRKDEFDHKKSHIVVDSDNLLIALVLEENSPLGTQITGKVELSDIFKKFGVNTGKEWDPEDLSDFIRMHRSYFENKTEAAELVTLLRNFKAKVEKDIEESNDKRGNVTSLRRQAVQSNLPPSITLHLPIFKGGEKEKVVCEVDINPNSLACQLISPDAEEIKQTTVDQKIANVVAEIEKIAPGIAIFYV